jgi:hypothetical protein
MPYVRCGKCVYKGHTCKDKGKKVGCSDSIEKAKKYLSKLRMEANENVMRKITKNKLMRLIKEELEVVLTDDEVEEMFDVNIAEGSNLSEVDQSATQPIPALQRPDKVPTVSEPALQRPGHSKVLKMLIEFVGTLEERVKALEAAANLPRE